jgi:predicted phosphodiesterase
MQIGVISDIHGNYSGLKRAIVFLESKRCKIVCLGDVVSDDSDDNDACIELLSSKKIFSVVGQHDDTCIKTNFPPIKAESLEYLRSMKVMARIRNILFVHDNPLQDARAGKGMWREGSYIKSLLEANVVLDSFDFDKYGVSYVFFGHSHIPAIFRNDHDMPLEFEKPIQLNDNKHLINPGRIGGVTRYPEFPPSFLIYNAKINAVTFYRTDKIPE